MPNSRSNVKSPKSKKSRLTKGELHEIITNMINHKGLSLSIPSPFNLFVYEIAPKVYKPIEISERGICQITNLDDISRRIIYYLNTTYPDRVEYKLSGRQAYEAAETWFKSTQPLKINPLPFSFKSEPSYCWHRNDFDIIAGPTPYFDELFSRMTNASAVKAWVWSLFEPRSYREQYVWLYGDGGVGKSKFLDFLKWILGKRNCLSQSSAPGSDKHWAVPFVGKKLILFPDFECYKSLDTPEMKALTGGDEIEVRPFYGPSYDYGWDGKLIFASNHLPNITSAYSNLRRIIFSEVSSFVGAVDSFYPEKLKGEAGAFLASCRQSYELLCKNHGKIPTDDSIARAVQECDSKQQDLYDHWFETNFVCHPEYSIKASDLAAHMHTFFNGNQVYIKKAYTLLSKKGFASKLVKRKGEVTRVYERFRLSDVAR